MPGRRTRGLLGRQRETKAQKNDDGKKSAFVHKRIHSQNTASASEILMQDMLHAKRNPDGWIKLRATRHTVAQSAFVGRPRRHGSLLSGPGPLGRAYRSEERRVGEECRSRWSAYH